MDDSALVCMVRVSHPFERAGVMSKGESPAILRDIHTLFHVGTLHGLTTGNCSSGSGPGRRASEAASPA